MDSGYFENGCAVYSAVQFLEHAAASVGALPPPRPRHLPDHMPAVFALHQNICFTRHMFHDLWVLFGLYVAWIFLDNGRFISFSRMRGVISKPR